jgi:hypothetical protein
MSDLPAWVYDVVRDLIAWQDHPTLFAEYVGVNGRHEFQSVEDCGCSTLRHVPAEVQAETRALTRYMAQRAVDETELKQLRQNLAAIEHLLDQRSELLAKAIGLDKPQHYEHMIHQVESLRAEAK